MIDLKAEHPYAQAAKQLNKLIRTGHSFSGHERNCLFLNVPANQDNARGAVVADRAATRFANVSSVSGWDFADDARALARCDWDGDGDLDVWVANRTGPQVRFLRNDLTNSSRSIAFRLTGTTSNRDAIGAKLTVGLSDGTTRVRCLHAGEGFLSQSSKTLHFGLGPTLAAEKVTVRWPDGNVEAFKLPEVEEDSPANRIFQLVESSGKVAVVVGNRRTLSKDLRGRSARVTPGQGISRERIEAKSQRPNAEPVASLATHHLLNQPLPLPQWMYENAEGKRLDATTSSDGMLLMLWSKTCPTCIQELDDWNDDAESARELGIQITALCVDTEKTNHVSDTSHHGIANDRDRNQTGDDLPSSVGPHPIAGAYANGRATTELLELLQLINNVVYKDDHRPLPLPTSFLINSQGELTAIYKGPVSVDRVRHDLRALSLWISDSVDEQGRIANDQVANERRLQSRDLATLPFAGRWIGRPGPYSLGKFNARLWEFGFSRIAADYAIRLPTSTYSKEKAKLLLSNSARFRDQGDDADADEQLRQLLEFDPDNPAGLFAKGTALARAGKLLDAVPYLERATASFRPPNANAHLNLGVALRRLKRTDQAQRQFEQAIALDPRLPQAHLSLGLLLANQRDFQSAVKHFEQATRLDETSLDAQLNLAAALLRLHDTKRALMHLDRAVTIDEKSVDAHAYRGEVLLQMDRLAEARNALKSAVRLEPDSSDLHFRLGEICERQGDIPATLASFQESLRCNPDQPTLATRVAWILATHPDPNLRDGALAVRLAEFAADATERKIAPVLDVLAAAYAENDEFDEAVSAANLSLTRLQSKENEKTARLVEQVRQRRDAYVEKRKFRSQTALSSP